MARFIVTELVHSFFLHLLNPLFFLYPEKRLNMALLEVSSQKTLLKTAILGLIAAAAFSSRLFSIVRYESVIHEFDPW